MESSSNVHIQAANRLNQIRANSDLFQDQLVIAMEGALNAQPMTFYDASGTGENLRTIKQSMVRGVAACLKSQSLPAMFKDGRLIRTPGAAPAASTISLEAGFIEASRVARAGAHVIVRPEQTRFHATGGTGPVAVETVASAFRTIEAATFSTVVDDDDAPVLPYPVNAADIKWEEAVAKSFRVEIPRAYRRSLTSEVICSEIELALAMGLGRAADEVLLSHIVAAAPTAFTLAKAAAQGLQLAELRGIVGTAGNGAIIAQDGALRAAGIQSELTADTAATIVGAFDRAAVAIHEKADVHFERTSLSGDLVVTVFAHLIPLLPDPAKFWTVEA